MRPEDLLVLYGSNFVGVHTVRFFGEQELIERPLASASDQIAVRVPRGATSGFVNVESQRISSPVALLVDELPALATSELLSLSEDVPLSPGYQDFTCRARARDGLSRVEIVFNDEHRHSCTFLGETTATCTFARFWVGHDLQGRRVPISCQATGVDGIAGPVTTLRVPIGSPLPEPPRAEFLYPTDGSEIPGGRHHDFSCRGTSEGELSSIEIVFNGEHRRTCAATGTSSVCTFAGFYVGSDLEGQAVPMTCTVTDTRGQQTSEPIRVEIGSSDTEPPRLDVIPPDGASLEPASHHRLECLASDDRALATVEILFDDEHPPDVRVRGRHLRQLRLPGLLHRRRPLGPRHPRPVHGLRRGGKRPRPCRDGAHRVRRSRSSFLTGSRRR